MSGHVPEDLLLAFIEGEVDDRVACAIAEHLDDCALCGTRAATMEPLAAAFASMEDPPTPFDLVEAALAELEQPERGPGVEVGVGVSLIFVAAVLALVGSDPVGTAVHLGVAADAFGKLGAHVFAGTAGAAAAASLTAFASLLGLLVVSRVAIFERRLS